MIPLCRYVKITCEHGKPPFVYVNGRSTTLIGRVVEQGSRLSKSCVVAHSSPSTCMVAPTTVTRFGEKVEYEIEELERNILVRIRREGSEDVYIYPRKVWEKVWTLVINPVLEGRKLTQQGAIFYGPPGTGKTSMASIIASIAGLEVVEFRPENVLRKWLGETEKHARSVLDRAELMEPSMVLMDDAEWATRARAELSENVSGGAALAYTGMLNILLHKIEEWYKEARRVLAIVTTNVSEELLDPALRRSGRLGKPIYIPLPDIEAVRIYLEELGVEPEQAEEYAIKIVNAGLSMADARAIAMELISGRKPMIEARGGTGYKRYVPPSMPKSVIDALSGLDIIFETVSNRSIVHIVANEPLAIPLAVTLIIYVAKMPAIILTDYRHLDDAISAAQATEGYLVVPSESTPKDAQLLAYSKLDRIVFAGERRAPGTYALELPLRAIAIFVKSTYKFNETLAKLVYSYYGIEYTDHDIERARRMETKQLIQQLLMAATYPGKAKEIARLYEGVIRRV